MFVLGTEEDLKNSPQNYVKLQSKSGPIVCAYGRDPYFDGWPDTVQLNYRHPECRKEMTNQILRIGKYADGLRCDMAMLLLEDVVQRVWGDRPMPNGVEAVMKSFWLDAIPVIRKQYPGFKFIAEVYWDKEYELQQQGFDYTYDKTLYDRLLKEKNPVQVRLHLHADPEYQARSVRFLENHDEPRVAGELEVVENHIAAAVITFLIPGLRFFHEGQLEGRAVRVSMHVGRRRQEEVNPALQDFYKKLVDTILVRPEVSQGDWTFLETTHAWEDNNTHHDFVCFSWSLKGEEGPQSILVVVNYSPNQGQTYVRLPESVTADFADKQVNFHDLLNTKTNYIRDGNEILEKGMYFDSAPFLAHVFQINPKQDRGQIKPVA